MFYSPLSRDEVIHRTCQFFFLLHVNPVRKTHMIYHDVGVDSEMRYNIMIPYCCYQLVLRDIVVITIHKK